MKNLEVRKLTGTTLLATLVVVLDYSMKYSGLKIPFPPFPTLMFDFTGIPIVLSMYLFGWLPGVFTSITALVAILVRSGNVVASSMKALAELSTVIGVAVASKISSKRGIAMQYLLGISSRCLCMVLLNFLLFGIYSVPFIVAFNIIQGSVSILGAYVIYEAVKRRTPFFDRTPNISGENELP